MNRWRYERISQISVLILHCHQHVVREWQLVACLSCPRHGAGEELRLAAIMPSDSRWASTRRRVGQAVQHMAADAGSPTARRHGERCVQEGGAAGFQSFGDATGFTTGRCDAQVIPASFFRPDFFEYQIAFDPPLTSWDLTLSVCAIIESVILFTSC